MNLSDQAIGTVMMALQKCLMEQSDITVILRDLDFEDTEEGLTVLNPPTVRFDDDEE
jgi:hypothetical protein